MTGQRIIIGISGASGASECSPCTACRMAGHGVTSYALLPGAVASGIWRRVPWPVRPLITRRMLSTEQGVQTSVYGAAAAEVAQASGRCYEGCRERPPSPVATGQLGRLLWEHSEAWTTDR